jgi:hypothetical protein
MSFFLNRPQSIRNGGSLRVVVDIVDVENYLRQRSWRLLQDRITKAYLFEECRLLGCYTAWFLQEPHGVTSQKTPFFIVTAVKTSNLTCIYLFLWCMLRPPLQSNGQSCRLQIQGPV